MSYLATVSIQYRLAKPETQLELNGAYFKREAIDLLIEEIEENSKKYLLHLEQQKDPKKPLQNMVFQ